MKTFAFILAVIGTLLALMLPAISAAQVAAERNQQTNRQRLGDVEGHLDDSPNMPALRDAIAETVAVGETISGRFDRMWWTMCIASVLCFAGAVALFFRPAPKKPVLRRRSPPPEFTNG